MGGVPLGGAVPTDVTTRAQTGHASETGLACYVRDGKLFMDKDPALAIGDISPTLIAVLPLTIAV
jgi:hypothetical protein